MCPPHHTMKAVGCPLGPVLCWAAALICLCCGYAIAQPFDGGSGSFELPIMHRFSQEFRDLARGRPEWAPFMAAWEELPPAGSAELYHIMAMQDRARHVAHGHRRSLAAANSTGVYSMYPSNETYYLSSLGQIHYTLIELGSPSKAFLVGLDTGSDLLWVPCDCKQCSTPNWASYGLNLSLAFETYSPANSTTGKAIPCSNAICGSTLSPSKCSAGAACTYNATYVSPNTSSSGTIVQDVIYLNPETTTGPNVTANIYFGCGSSQTGSFLLGGAPNGLFGLGPEVYSVPRTLAANGVTQDIFSMCFSTSIAVGRLVFGRKPTASLPSTPFVKVSPNVLYVLHVEDIVAGGAALNITGPVVFDTGSSFTTLPSNIIKSVGDQLASTTTLTTWSFNYQSLVFNYCWNATTDSEIETLSSLSFTFRGGGTWVIAQPLVLFADNGVLVFVCLGMLPSDSSTSIPIIGHNFMPLYDYYFDMENSTFSWTPSDCSGYNETGIGVSPASSPSPSPAPSPSPSPSTTSSKSPASPPKSSGSPPAHSPASPHSNAHRTTISTRSIWIQILLLTFLTLFLHSVVTQIN